MLSRPTIRSSVVQPAAGHQLQGCSAASALAPERATAGAPAEGVPGLPPGAVSLKVRCRDDPSRWPSGTYDSSTLGPMVRASLGIDCEMDNTCLFQIRGYLLYPIRPSPASPPRWPCGSPEWLSLACRLPLMIQLPAGSRRAPDRRKGPTVGNLADASPPGRRASAGRGLNAQDCHARDSWAGCLFRAHEAGPAERGRRLDG